MRLTLILAAALVMTGCNQPHAEFWNRVSALCGNTYSGELVSEDEQDAKFRDASLKVSFDACSETAIDMTLLVDGQPYSHWALTRDKDRLELRHHHESGVTGYGGFSDDRSSGSRINFPADEVTKSLFDAADLAVSKQNVWALEARDGAVFVYELARPGRLFRIEFQTTNALGDMESEG